MKHLGILALLGSMLFFFLLGMAVLGILKLVGILNEKKRSNKRN